MGTGKATRLSKAAREFNVGISTIVEFLHKKGFDIDSNPNTKISEELYDILVNEYSSDIDVKKQSEKLSLEQLRNKKETVSIEDDQEEEVAEEEEAEEEPDSASNDEEEIIIKDVSSPVSSVKEEKKDVKVVGKIDLEDKAEKKKEEKPEPEKEEAEKEEKEKPKQEEPKKEVEEEQTDEKESLKVVGKIDLSTINQKTRPDKKSRKQRQEEQQKAKAEQPKKKQEKTEKPKQEKEPVAEKRSEHAKTESKPEEELYKSKIEKLSGPTVVGKINLPDPPKEKKKEPVASSDDQKNKKKKRKRIHKDKERVDVSQKGGDGAQHKGKKPDRDKHKKGKKKKRNMLFRSMLDWGKWVHMLRKTVVF